MSLFSAYSGFSFKLFKHIPQGHLHVSVKFKTIHTHSKESIFPLHKDVDVKKKYSEVAWIDVNS